MINILEVKEVCEMLKVSRPTLASLPIPFIRVGKRIKYLESDVYKFLEQNKGSPFFQQATPEQKTIARKRMREKISQYKEIYSKSELG